MIGSVPEKHRRRGDGKGGRRALAVALVLATSAGCASLPRDHRLADGQPLLPSDPAATQYLAPSARAPADNDPFRRAMARTVAEAAANAGLPAPVRDERLDRLAGDIARGTRADEEPSVDLVSFLMAHHGMIEPHPNLVVVRGPAPGAQAIADHLRPQLPDLLRQGPNQRLGIGVWRSRRETAVVLALQDQHLDLRPVPRAVPAGQGAAIVGRLRAGHHTPEVIVAPPRGPVIELPVEPSSEGWFETTFTCDGEPGRFQVEIVARDARGPRVLANFPLYCAVAPPARSPPLPPASAPPRDPRHVASELLTLINRDRVAAGLAGVELDEGLSELAQGQSREMAATGVVATVSPHTGNPVDRVRSRGLTPSAVAEIVGRAHSADSFHRAIMSSPSNRRNVLDPSFTHIGIAVTAGPREFDSLPLFVTEVFARGL